ncbi:MAG TPA: hypothetical protein VF758_07600, partial [Candidatus Acidoferrum sp.]
TGVGLSLSCSENAPDDCEDSAARVLYVADSLNNRIAAISHPLTRSTPSIFGHTVSSGGSLNDPLGLTVAPDGHIFAVNGNDGFVTEITPSGAQVGTRLLDNTGSPAGAGALFGVVFAPAQGLVYVDDAANTLNVLH